MMWQSNSQTNHSDGTDSIQLEMDSNEMWIRQHGSKMSVSLQCPQFVFKEGITPKDIEANSIEGNIYDETPVKFTFESIMPDFAARMEVELFVQWFRGEGVLRKWARFKVNQPSAERVLHEVILEQYETTGNDIEFIEFQAMKMQSHPAFFKGFFVGVEFPVASTRLEADKLLVAHKPGLKMESEVWYETKKAVYGISAFDQEKIAFQKYLRTHSVTSDHFHINYNSWYTSPVPYSENDILQIMQEFKENLYDKHGVSFDTFCIDMGWSNPHSIWEINEKLFPEGFSRLEQVASSMNSHLGLWISPTACYMDALDNDWAEEQGYGTSSTPWVGDHLIRFVCLGSKKYQEKLKERLTHLIQNNKIRHIKFDGCMMECKEEHHGHEPGALSSEAIAEGIIDVFQELRKVRSDVWFETTCFGWNPSPWWLFYANSVLGTHGDDVPFGRVPAPVYRESYTSARDFFNLQGTCKVNIPAESQEVLGIVHQTQDSFLNDAVMTIARGHMFLPVYMNPKSMTDSRWKVFADLLRWAQANASTLLHTEALLPASWLNGGLPDFSNEGVMPREPYGYAHWKDGTGLVILRNPWISPGIYSIKIPESMDSSLKDAVLQAVSIYPQVRLYDQDLRCGDTLDIQLAPYETVLLSIKANQSIEGVPEVGEIIRPYIKADVLQCMMTSTSLHLEAALKISAPQTELLILLEGKGTISLPNYRIKINGSEAEVIKEASDEGWVHSWIPKREDWLFLKVPLSTGDSLIDGECSFDITITNLSIWVWASKLGGGHSVSKSYPNALPEPELISLSAFALLNTVDISSLN